MENVESTTSPKTFIQKLINFIKNPSYFIFRNSLLCLYLLYLTKNESFLGCK